MGEPDCKRARVSSRWSLEGKSAVITGSTKGIGAAAAEEMLQLGASVMIVSRKQDEVGNCLSALRAKWPDRQVEGCAADVSTAAGRQLLADAASKAFNGRLHCLVNNVGTNIRKPIQDATEEEYRTMLSTNLDSSYFLCKLMLPLLRAAEGSCVVNVSSAAGVNSTGTGAIYGMTKAAMIQLTKSLACEWGGVGIRVNCVAPWMTITPLLMEAVKKNPSSLDKAKEWTPMQRLAEPHEIAGAICFLCLPAASYVSGQTISVDGALSANGFAGPCLNSL